MSDNGSGGIKVNLHHAEIVLKRAPNCVWLKAEADNIDVALFSTPEALRKLAGDIIEEFGPVDVVSAEVEGGVIEAGEPSDEF